MKKLVQRVSRGQGGQGLIISHITFDGALAVDQKQAIIPIDPEATDEEVIDAQKGAVLTQWKLEGRPNLQNGFMQIRKIGSLDKDSEITEKGNSLSVVLEREEETTEDATRKQRDVVQQR